METIDKKKVKDIFHSLEERVEVLQAQLETRWKMESEALADLDEKAWELRYSLDQMKNEFAELKRKLKGLDTKRLKEEIFGFKSALDIHKELMQIKKELNKSHGGQK